MYKFSVEKINPKEIPICVYNGLNTPFLPIGNKVLAFSFVFSVLNSSHASLHNTYTISLPNKPTHPSSLYTRIAVKSP